MMSFRLSASEGGAEVVFLFVFFNALSDLATRRPGAESAVTVAEPLAVTAPFSSIVVQSWPPPPPRGTGVFDSFDEVLSNLGKKII